jgi:hypothetical protein
MTLPQWNAQLLRISDQGFTPDADLPETAGATLWEGVSKCTVRERVVVSTAGGRLDQYRRVTLTIPGDLNPSVDIDTGQLVTVFYANSEKSYRVKDYSAALLTGAPKTVRIEVEDT